MLRRLLLAASLLSLLTAVAIAAHEESEQRKRLDFPNCDPRPENDGRIVQLVDALNVGDCSLGGGTAAPFICICDGTAALWKTQAEIAGDAHYLRLDATNDPVTANLEIETTTNPRLTLKSTSTTGIPLLTLENAAPQVWEIRLEGSSVDELLFKDDTASTTPFKLGIAAPTDSLVIEATTGDIGIGIASPTAALHIQRAGASVLRLERDSPAIAGTIDLIVHGTQGSHIRLSPRPLTSGDQGSVTLLRETDGDVNSGLYIYAADATSTVNHFFGGHAQNSYVNTTTGQFGVGTTTPDAKLHVVDSGTPTTLFNVDVVAGFQRDGTTSEIAQIAIMSGNIAKAKLVFGDTDNYRQGRVEYDHNIDDLSFWTSSTEKLTIESGGDVGIGTANPGADLHILQTTGNTKVKVECDGADCSVDYDLTNDAQTWKVQVAGTDGNRFRIADVTAGTTPIRLDTGIPTSTFIIRSSGNVGISTSSPDADLHVLGGGTPSAIFDAAVVVAVQDTTAASTDAGLAIMAGTTGLAELNFGDSGDFDIGRIVYDNNLNDLSLWVANSQILTIEDVGQVGIGTASPAAELEIESATNPQLRMDSTSATGIPHIAFVNTSPQTWQIRLEGSSAQQLMFRDDTAGTFPFRIEAGAPTAALVIESSGDVGIGTASADASLHVLASGTPTTLLDNAVVAGFQSSSVVATNAGLAVMSGTTGLAELNFGDTGDFDIGRIVYDNNIDALSLWTNNTQRFTIESGGDVGIGETAPDTALQIGSDISISFMPPPTSTGKLWVGESKSDAENNPLAQFSQIQASSTGGATGVEAYTATTNTTGSIGRNTAVVGAADHVGVGTLADARGGSFSSFITGAGTITDAIGVFGTYAGGGDGSTITNGYGLKVTSGPPSGSGVITNGFGVHIDTQSGTNTFGVFQLDAGDTNHWAGPHRQIETTTTPPTPAAGSQVHRYMKADKIIYQYNDGGTVRYKYLSFIGTGVTWVHTTTAP